MPANAFTPRKDSETMSIDCQLCNGTGQARSNGTRVRCWTCNGNGLDPAAYFRWTPHPTADADALHTTDDG